MVERTKEKARELAQAAVPWITSAFVCAREGKVHWNDKAMDLMFDTLDEMSDVIDDPENGYEEDEKALLHAFCSFIIRMRKGGLMTDAKLKRVVALADVFVELYGQVSEIVGLDVDRSPSDG